jgi:hypothetical protein
MRLKVSAISRHNQLNRNPNFKAKRLLYTKLFQRKKIEKRCHFDLSLATGLVY